MRTLLEETIQSMTGYALYIASGMPTSSTFIQPIVFIDLNNLKMSTSSHQVTQAYPDYTDG
jgi:hypothetical protein